MYFGLSPIAGTIIGIIFIAWLIGFCIKSAGKKVFESPREPMSEEELRQKMKELGPITWKEHLVGILAIMVILILNVAFIIWLTE
jgi:hypothetical protein